MTAMHAARQTGRSDPYVCVCVCMYVAMLAPLYPAVSPSPCEFPFPFSEWKPGRHFLLHDCAVKSGANSYLQVVVSTSFGAGFRLGGGNAGISARRLRLSFSCTAACVFESIRMPPFVGGVARVLVASLCCACLVCGGRHGCSLSFLLSETRVLATEREAFRGCLHSRIGFSPALVLRLLRDRSECCAFSALKRAVSGISLSLLHVNGTVRTFLLSISNAIPPCG